MSGQRLVQYQDGYQAAIVLLALGTLHPAKKFTAGTDKLVVPELLRRLEQACRPWSVAFLRHGPRSNAGLRTGNTAGARDGRASVWLADCVLASSCSDDRCIARSTIPEDGTVNTSIVLQGL